MTARAHDDNTRRMGLTGLDTHGGFFGVRTSTTSIWEQYDAGRGHALGRRFEENSPRQVLLAFPSYVGQS